ncbi:MAG TPA: DUF2062 domain-containing protein [Thermodesulfovibrionales bacterium]|nr:DUF2062 domain-containing protein [Thermodesulfovibrionales bacterium]
MAFRDRIRDVIKLKESPHKIALAFSTGVFIGISPLLGLHTILGVTVAWLFRLNTFAIITGVYVMNPWTIVPIYAFSTWLGAKCLGLEQMIPEIDWSNVTFSDILSSLEHLIVPFLFGTFLMGSITSFISYIIIYRAIKRSNILNL